MDHAYHCTPAPTTSRLKQQLKARSRHVFVQASRMRFIIIIMTYLIRLVPRNNYYCVNVTGNIFEKVQYKYYLLESVFLLLASASSLSCTKNNTLSSLHTYNSATDNNNYISQCHIRRNEGLARRAIPAVSETEKRQIVTLQLYKYSVHIHLCVQYAPLLHPSCTV